MTDQNFRKRVKKMTETQISKAIRLARKAHAYEVDSKGEPYIRQLHRFANKMTGLYDRCLVYLHEGYLSNRITEEDLQNAEFDIELINKLHQLKKGA